jgi:hypothetical protein
MYCLQQGSYVYRPLEKDNILILFLLKATPKAFGAAYARYFSLPAYPHRSAYCSAFCPSLTFTIEQQKKIFTFSYNFLHPSPGATNR